MSCARCQGLMVRMDLEDAGGSTYSCGGWRCLLCGEVTDRGIKANRKSPPKPRRNRVRPHGTW
jgi:hypothetical protein